MSSAMAARVAQRPQDPDRLGEGLEQRPEAGRALEGVDLDPSPARRDERRHQKREGAVVMRSKLWCAFAVSAIINGVVTPSSRETASYSLIASSC